MVNKNRKTGLIIGSIVLLGAAGGIGYWLWKKAKDKKDAEAARLAAEANNSAGTDTTSTDSTKPDSGTTVTTDKPADIKAFQDWMDKYHPNWVNGKNLNKGSGYGSFGPATKGAWAAWKTEYSKTAGPVAPVQTKKSVTSLTLQNPAALRGKKIYANNDLTPILNILGDKRISRAKKDELLGQVTSVERTSSGNYLVKVVTPTRQYISTYDFTVYYY